MTKRSGVTKIQASILNNKVDKEFIDLLDDAGKKSLEEFKVVEEALLKNIEEGLIDESDLKVASEQFISSLSVNNSNIKLGGELLADLSVNQSLFTAFTYSENFLQVFDFVVAIVMNIPVIAVSILKNKLPINDIMSSNIQLIKYPKGEGIEISSVYYTTKYGSRIEVDLQEIYDILLKIDFE